MNVVVLGGRGMLGTDLVAACLRSGMEVRSLHRPMFDITDPDALGGCLAPGSVVVNCAAYTRGDELRVVNDQICAPTYTRRLARAILALIETNHIGIVHVSVAGPCSWHDFAVEIARRVKPSAVVHPVSTEEYPTPARRPAYSVLDNSRYIGWVGSPAPGWKRGLSEYLDEMEV